MGRNIARAPGLWQLDTSLQKRFSVTERFGINFRAEAFNIFNQTNYGFPSSGYSPTSTSFGVVTAATTAPSRILQFAGKIIF